MILQMSVNVNKNCTGVVETAILVALEAALLEYVERYGPTDRARTVLQRLSRLAAAQNHID